MDAARQRLETLFDAALGLPTPAERAAFLDRECAGDTQLRGRLERLLSAHGKAENFFDDCRPALAVAEPGDVVSETTHVEAELGKQIGPYKLLQKIGEGGCGVVYMAEQEKPVRRRVALKIIKLGMDTKSVIARFEAERQALALMDHPNIARVLDAGATETGRPYFVMELVNGIKITNYCDERQLDTEQRLELFIQVCHAIQHAHQKGVIHRDIKPSNILVTLHDGEPVPKVIDFGIAKAIEEKLTDKTLFTVYGHFIGTPAYMSPEQADFSGLDIDTRSDIYSLGVLLYELLTGKTPFDQTELLASGLDEMRRTLREREPHRPSTKLDTMPNTELTMTAQRRHIEPPKLHLLLAGDLDWIVMKALEKDRNRRYETANGLGLDIQRYLNDEPVLARPPSRWYRFQKLARRNRGVFAAASAVTLALVIGLGTATWLFFMEREMRHRAVEAEQQAEHARLNEAELRRQAEAREQLTQAALLINQGKYSEADKLTARTVFLQPTLEGAAVLRALGEWHALNSRWPLASERFLTALKIDQLDDKDVASLDFLALAAALAAAGDTNRFESFRHNLASRFAGEKNSFILERVIKAGLLLPAENGGIQSLQSLARATVPAVPASVGTLRPSAADMAGGDFLQKLKLQNVGTKQPFSMNSAGGVITMVAGGADIWGKQDEFTYAFTTIAGDFDFRMQVLSIAPKPDAYTRIGLMVRELPDEASSRHVMVALNATNTFQVVMRSQVGAAATSVPQDPLPEAYGSNSWVRLQRVGAIFHAYTSSNGLDWVQLYQTTGGDKPFSDPICFGIAASSHSRESVVTNIVGSFGATPTVTANGALTLALLEYRNGDFHKAADWCQRLLTYPDCDALQNATAQVILAMADQRRHPSAEVRQQLAQARDVIERKFSNGLEAGNKTDGFWYDWVFARVLLTEADAAGR